MTKQQKISFSLRINSSFIQDEQQEIRFEHGVYWVYFSNIFE